MRKATIGTSNLLKPAHDKRFYKNEDAYLRAVYRKNPQIRAEGFTFSMFKENIKNIRAEEGYTTGRAISAFGRTRAFMSREEIAFENIKKYGSKEDLLRIRKLTGEYRRGVKMEDFKWDEQKQMFVHKSNKFGIQFSNPEDSETESVVEVFTF